MRNRSSLVAALGLVACSAAVDTPGDRGRAEPARDRGEGVPCAYVDGGSAGCMPSCSENEVCFTQVICSPSPDGGSGCTSYPGPGDNRCRKDCRDGSCADGEDCITVPFFACTDFNGGAGGRRVCLARER